MNLTFSGCMQEADKMKKTIGLILALCLVFVLAADAFAAGKPAFTKQPETSTTNKKGTVSFSVKTTGSIQSLTWYFIDPATGNSYTGKQLAKHFKGLSVGNPNGKKITLKKVPEAMHGWTVYCHVNGNGYKLDSDRVQLLVYGMEAPAQGIVEAEVTSSSGNNSAASSGSSETGDEQDEDSSSGEMQDRTFTVSCSGRLLRKLDSAGKIIDGAPVSSLEFTNTGSFIVTSEEPIKSWTANGIRFEPAEPLKEFKVMNVTASLTLDVKIDRTAADVQVDESNMCKVTCSGCTFSYLRGQLLSVSSGEVPAGAQISIVSDSSDMTDTGYRINGGDISYSGISSFMITVTGDTEIVVEK